MCPRHPEIKRVMHEEIGQGWAHHSALQRTAASLNHGSICFHHGRLQPSFDVQERPLTHYVLPNGPQQKFVIDVVKGSHDTLPIIRTFLSKSRSSALAIRSRASRSPYLDRRIGKGDCI
jgi:hypothetical protein